MNKKITALSLQCLFIFAMTVFAWPDSNQIFAKPLSELENSNFKKAVDAVKSKKYGVAVTLFEEQALNARHDAQYNLAILLQAGKGRPRNYTEALFWAWQAELGGIEEAKEISNTVIDLLPEDVVDKIRSRVQDALQKRVDDGDLAAISQLGKFFMTIPKEEDYLNSYIWYSIARALGIPDTEEPRDDAEKQLEQKELVEAQLKTDELFKRYDFNSKNNEFSGGSHAN